MGVGVMGASSSLTGIHLPSHLSILRLTHTIVSHRIALLTISFPPVSLMIRLFRNAIACAWSS